MSYMLDIGQVAGQIVKGLKDRGWFADNPTNPHVPGAIAGGEIQLSEHATFLSPSLQANKANPEGLHSANWGGNLYFRMQHSGESFAKIKRHVSAGIEDLTSGSRKGVAVSGQPDGMDGGSAFGGSWDAMNDNDDLVILQGDRIGKLYDGYVIKPTREVARYKVGDWKQMIEDGTAQEIWE